MPFTNLHLIQITALAGVLMLAATPNVDANTSETARGHIEEAVNATSSEATRLSQSVSEVEVESQSLEATAEATAEENDQPVAEEPTAVDTEDMLVVSDESTEPEEADDVPYVLRLRRARLGAAGHGSNDGSSGTGSSGAAGGGGGAAGGGGTGGPL
jgi:hypothetical protein